MCAYRKAFPSLFMLQIMLLCRNVWLVELITWVVLSLTSLSSSQHHGLVWLLELSEMSSEGTSKADQHGAVISMFTTKHVYVVCV